jgi:hypothetical protein
MWQGVRRNIGGKMNKKERKKTEDKLNKKKERREV